MGTDISIKLTLTGDPSLEDIRKFIPTSISARVFMGFYEDEFCGSSFAMEVIKGMPGLIKKFPHVEGGVQMEHWYEIDSEGHLVTRYIRRGMPSFPITPVTALLFGGDRALHVDESVVAENGFEDVVGLATIAPKGESGHDVPTIVGLWVHPSFRGRGHGRNILQDAISRCRERGFGSVRVDALSSAANKVIRELNAEDRGFLDVHASTPPVLDYIQELF